MCRLTITIKIAPGLQGEILLNYASLWLRVGHAQDTGLWHSSLLSSFFFFFFSEWLVKKEKNKHNKKINEAGQKEWVCESLWYVSGKSVSPSWLQRGHPCQQWPPRLWRTKPTVYLGLSAAVRPAAASAAVAAAGRKREDWAQAPGLQSL